MQELFYDVLFGKNASSPFLPLFPHSSFNSQNSPEGKEDLLY